MNKTRHFFCFLLSALFLLLLLLPALPPRTASAAQISFSETFEGGASTLWDLERGQMTLTMHNGSTAWAAGAHAPDREDVAFIGEDSWTNYAVQFDFTVGAPSNAGVLVRAQRLTSGFTGLWIGVDETGRLIIGKFRPGWTFYDIPEELASIPSFAVGNTYRVRVECYDALVSVSVDGSPVITFTDLNFPSGKVALRSCNSASYFDNIEITGLESAPSSAALVDNGRAYTGSTSFSMDVSNTDGLERISLYMRSDLTADNNVVNVSVNGQKLTEQITFGAADADPGDLWSQRIEIRYDIPLETVGARKKIQFTLERVTGPGMWIDINVYMYRLVCRINGVDYVSDVLDVGDPDSERAHGMSFVGQSDWGKGGYGAWGRRTFCMRSRQLDTYFPNAPDTSRADREITDTAAKDTEYGMADFLTFGNIAELRPYVTSGQQSSFDRSGGNADGFFYIGDSESTTDVTLLDLNSPGVITRMWFTGNPQARLRVYFDGETNARIDMTVSELTSGAHMPFLFPLVGNDTVSSGGYYCFLPIPFGRSVKILGDGMNFFNINYNLYPNDAKIETFTGRENVTDTLKTWRSPEEDPKTYTDAKTYETDFSLSSGEQVLLDYKGKAGITGIEVSADGLQVNPSGVVEDAGLAYDGKSEFTVTVDPDNTGVKLVKRIDYGIADQCVELFLKTDSDWTSLGRWIADGSNGDFRWKDVSFEVPAQYTAGKSELTFRSEYFSSGGTDVNEFYYWVYSEKDGAQTLSDFLDVGDRNSQTRHRYTITGQKWSGTNSFEYYPDETFLASREPLRKFLNETRLVAYWDDETTPSVNVPLSSLSGTGEFGGYETKTLMFGIYPTENGIKLYCRYPMPFGKNARILLVRESAESAVKVHASVTVSKSYALTDEVGYFKTAYGGGRTTVGEHVTILDLESGQGHIVGLTESMTAPPIPGYLTRFYLEGDEKLYVDGSKGYSAHGTGTEDVYCGAWYFTRGTFTLPTHGNPAHTLADGSVISPDLAGSYFDATTAYRLYVTDPLVFRDGVTFVIEHGASNEMNAYIATCAFYYYRETPAMTHTDHVVLGDAADRERTGYTNETGYDETVTGSYDALFADVAETYTGYTVLDESSLTVTLNSDNAGVILRRVYKFDIVKAKAAVYADGAFVGIWTSQFDNMTQPYLSQDTFFIPESFTKGKGTITLKFVNISDENRWVDAAYDVFSLTPVKKEAGGGNKTALIAGLCAGGAVLLLAAGAVTVLLLKRKKKVPPSSEE